MIKRTHHIQRYEKYLSEDPENIILLTTLGNLYHQDNRLVDAITCFKKCLALDNKNPITKIGLAKILITAKRYHLAEKILSHLIKQGYVDCHVLQDLGVSLYFQQRWDEAFQQFEKAGLDDINNLHFACYCLHQQKQYAKALSYTKKLTTLHNSHETQSYLALLEADNNHFVIAKKRATEILKRQPKNIHANLTLVLCLLEYNEYEAARPYIEEVLTESPKHTRALLYLSLHHLLQQQPLLALSTLSNMKDHSANLVLYIMLGWIKLVMNEPLDAEEYFHKALLLNAHSPDAYGGLIALYKLKQDTHKTQEYIDKIKAIDKLHPSIALSNNMAQSHARPHPEAIYNNGLITYLRELITEHTRGTTCSPPKMIHIPNKVTKHSAIKETHTVKRDTELQEE